MQLVQMRYKYKTHIRVTEQQDLWLAYLSLLATESTLLYKLKSVENYRKLSSCKLYRFYMPKNTG